MGTTRLGVSEMAACPVGTVGEGRRGPFCLVDILSLSNQAPGTAAAPVGQFSQQGLSWAEQRPSVFPQVNQPDSLIGFVCLAGGAFSVEGQGRGLIHCPGSCAGRSTEITL